MIRAYQVKGNHWLDPKVVEETVYPYLGPKRTADDVEHARAALQKAFETRGYATVAVIIPEQSVDTGIIRLEVQPQVIGKVTVSGAAPRLSGRLLSQAPSLREGGVPNFQDVQRDVVALNSSPDHQVTPEVTAGAAPGSLDVNLKVKETSPWHASAEVNNYASPSTTPLRIAGSAGYDDLWGRGDSVTISGSTAPDRWQDATVGSINYLTHLSRSVELLSYFVHSSSNVGIVGGTTVIGKGDMAGLRLIVPLAQSATFYDSVTVGIDYKHFGETVALGADSSASPILYFPLTAAWRGDWKHEHNKSYLSTSVTFGLRGIGDELAQFDARRFGATPDFFYIKAEASTVQDAWANFQVSVHLSGQFSDSALVSNEQFSLGGEDTVRGYYESELLGDSGVAVQLELRSPNLFFTGPDAANELRLLGFDDEGYEQIRQPLAGQTPSDWLHSVGGGLRLKLVKYFNGALDAGVPYRNGPNTHSGHAFIRFRVWGEL